MNEPQTSLRKPARRRWLWLFAALLPLALYAVIVERNSWRPRTLYVAKPDENIYPGRKYITVHWLNDSKRFYVTSSSPSTTSSSMQCWDAHRGIRLKEWTFPKDCYCSGAEWLTNPEGKLAVTRDYNPNRMWVPGATQIIDVAEYFRPLLFTGNSLMGWKWNGDNIKIVWWSLRANTFERATQVRPPHGYTFYGHKSEIGHQDPLIDLSSDGKTGFLALFRENQWDGGTAITARHVLIFDPTTGQHRRVLELAEEGSRISEGHPLLRCADNGRLLLIHKYRSNNATAKGRPHALELWNSQTGRLLHSWPQQKLSVSVDITRDGSLLACAPDWWNFAADEKNVRLWDAGTGKLLREFKLQRPVNELKISPDKRTISVADYYGTITLWRVN
jgi:hypothetical protein